MAGGLRQFLLPAYLPVAAYGVGAGALAPVGAIYALEIGASPALAALLAAASGLGTLVADLPVGVLVARIGERRAMFAAIAVDLAAIALIYVVPALPTLFAGLLVIGFSQSVWGLARQSFVGSRVDPRLRARALSTLGGAQRMGVFVGPFLATLVLSVAETRAVYLVLAGSAVVSAVLLAFAKDPGEEPPPAGAAPAAESMAGLIRRQAPVLRTVGVVVLLLSVLRSTRSVVLVLWGTHLGLDAAQIALVFGIAGAVEMTLFYPAGKIMDLYGRRATAVPCLAILGVSVALLPFAGDAVSFALVAVLMGVGNGLGSGIIMTLGSDYAPPASRAKFLGAWRSMIDLGLVAGPSALSSLVVVSGLATGYGLLAAGGLVGAALAARWIPGAGGRGRTAIAPIP